MAISTPTASTDRGVPRISTRLAVELVVDSFEHYEEPKAVLKHVKEAGFFPELLRTKAYLNPPAVVVVVPVYSMDLRRFGAISIRRDLDGPDKEDVAAAGTIVTVDTVMTPTDLTLVKFDKGKAFSHGPITFDELSRKGAGAVLRDLKLDPTKVVLGKFSRGRGLAPLVLEDMVADEVHAGYLSEAEASRVLSNVELSADIARLHAYVSEAMMLRAGCSACCSSSCFGCTSCSCVIFELRATAR
jgi:hypothetical protein